MKTMRLFVAIELSDAFKEALIGVQHQVKKTCAADMRLVSADQLHLTLQFLGNVSEDQLSALKDALMGVHVKPFEVCLGPWGVLPHKNHIRVIYVDLISEHLAVLAQDIAVVTKEFIKPEYREDRDFLSHITIARVKHVENAYAFMQALEEIQVPNLCNIVNSFVLKESVVSSDGAQHKVIQEYKLLSV